VSEQIAVVFAFDYPPHQVFHLDLMLAVGIASGTVYVILWCVVQIVLVIPIKCPLFLNAERILTCSALHILIVHAKIAFFLCTCFAKHVRKNFILLVWLKQFAKE
jgi:hypothetical protein